MKKILAIGLFAAFISPLASAHTIAFGTINAGVPGSVTIWLGSYHNAGSNVEGTMTLTDLNGVPITPNASNFNVKQASGAIPAGLVAGTNLFYSPDDCCNSAPGIFANTVNGTDEPLNVWQSITFNGLVTGLYDYTISGMNSDNWRDWGSNTPNWSGQVNITGAVIGNVPVSSTLSLLGISLAAFGFLARRRRLN